MTKEELISKLTEWKVTNSKAYDILVAGTYDLKVQAVNDIANLRNTLLDECTQLEANVEVDADGLANAILTQKNVSTAALENLITAASIPDPVVVPAPTQDKVGILVPLYSYPGGSGLLNWDAVIAAAPKVPILLIANPASGPGATVNSDYVKAIARAKTAGAKVLGYVSTSYGNRAVADVKADIVKWKTFYGVVNIFLDEQANNLANVPKYADYVAFIKANGGYAVTNPGASCIQEYYTVAKADTILLSEKGGDINPAPAWALPAPDKYFAGICYATDQVKALELVAKSRTLGYGWIYVTNDTYTNPWDSLPTYWLTLVDAVAKLV